MGRAVRNPPLRKALLAFFAFNLAELGVWVALLVWAYSEGGIRGASILAVVQLIPACLLAPVGATLLDKLDRGRALTIGYLAQALTFAVTGMLLAMSAPYTAVATGAAAAAVAVTLTRPVHFALLPQLSDTTADLTAGNGLSTTAEGAAGILGPLISGLLTAWLGPQSVLLFFAVTSALAALTVVRLRPRGATRAVAPEDGDLGLRVLVEVVRDPNALLLTALTGLGFVVVGMLDLLLVALAISQLDMSEAGPGILSSALGIGVILGGVTTVVLVGRRRLAPPLLASVCLFSAALVLLGTDSVIAVAMVLVMLVGAGKSFFDVAARTLTQRALPDRLLTAVFGLQESMMMAGLALGSLLVPILTSLFGTRGAFVAAGVFILMVTLAAYPWIRRLDLRTEVRFEVYRLFAGVPMLALLPQRVLERLVRDARRVGVPAGSAVITEGEEGDLFYAIEDGVVEVSHDHEILRTLGPSDWFGEIALLRGVPRTATVTTVVDVRLVAIDRASFLTAVTGAPPAIEASERHASTYQHLPPHDDEPGAS